MGENGISGNPQIGISGIAITNHVASAMTHGIYRARSKDQVRPAMHTIGNDGGGTLGRFANQLKSVATKRDADRLVRWFHPPTDVSYRRDYLIGILRS